MIRMRPELFMRQGAVVAAWRTYRQRKLGPYFHLVFRDEGRQKSIYLGRPGPLVDEVRQLLAAVQGPLRRRRQFDRTRRQAMAAFRLSNLNLGRLLAPLGLRMKGLQIRGWHNLPRLPRLP